MEELTISKAELTKLLNRYFNVGDSDVYNLTRSKEAFEAGTMTLDDFTEFNEDNVEDLINWLCTEITKQTE